MITVEDTQRIIGHRVEDPNGQKIGEVGQVYLDDDSNQPEWVTVRTGLFGTSETFVPLADASVEGDRLRVPYAKAQVKDAPRIDADDDLSPDQEDELYRYYGLQYGQSGYSEESARGGTAGYADTGYHGESGVTADEAGYAETESGYRARGDEGLGEDAMTRSEERVDVGKETREAGRARLRKYVVTENVQTTVPVTREEVRVEREPITDENRDAALSGPDISEGEHEVTLHEEQVVVDKEAVPVERVRLAKDEVTEERQVDEEVRKERIDVDADDESRLRDR